MMGWLNRDVHCTGSVLFRGKMAPRLEELNGLAKFGVRVRPKGKDARVHWAAEAEHERWGKALFICLRDAPQPPKLWIEHDAGLSGAEREQALTGQSHVSVRIDGSKNHLLRDRKRFLGFLRAVMGDDGAVAADHGAMRLWSRQALDDELSHDADVDIEALYCLHAVAHDVPEGSEEEPRPAWLHTHGLAQIGFFDFDILNPAAELLNTNADALRALALAIVEGQVNRSTPSFGLAQPGGNVRFVDVAEFNRKADPATRALRSVDDADEEHNKDRAVLCEPAGGLLGRFFDKVKPNRWLSGPIPEEGMMTFSTAAGELMAERARATWGRFRALTEEFADFEFPALVKLAYVVDGGGPEDKEHMWFSVDDAHDDYVNATLRVQPFNIARMKEGQKGSHRLEVMSDWSILTPAGMITPRNTAPARLIREHAPEIRQAMAQQRAGR